MSHLLVDQMCDEPRAGHATRFVVSFEAAFEVQDQSLQQKFADVGEFRVDDGQQGCVDVSEGGGSSLGLKM